MKHQIWFAKEISYFQSEFKETQTGGRINELQDGGKTQWDSKKVVMGIIRIFL